jgi:hypothetical protein
MCEKADMKCISFHTKYPEPLYEGSVTPILPADEGLTALLWANSSTLVLSPRVHRVGRVSGAGDRPIESKERRK